MNDLSQWVGLAGAPLVQALTEWIKQLFPTLDKRFYSSIAVVWGMLLNLALAAAVSGLTWSGAVWVVVVGIATGLLASGLYKMGRGSTDVVEPRG